MTYPKIIKDISKSWSFPTKLSAGILLTVVILLVAALGILFTISHNSIEKESLAKAEETLTGTVARIENTLHEVAVATTNMQWNVEHHLDNPEAMALYTRELVKNNNHIVGCAIAFEPGYYKGEGELFMRYTYINPAQDNSLTTSGNPKIIEPDVLSGSPYLAHNWYNIAKNVGQLVWVRPHAEGDTILSSTISCCVPLRDKNGKIVGVLASDVSLDWLSETVLSTKPYPNSYCCMLGVQGTYLIHPDSTRLYHTFVADVIAKDSTNTKVKMLVDSMLKGEDGCRSVQLFGKDCYVLYQALNEKHWSACIVCPESDIFYANKRLTLHAALILLAGLLGIFAFCIVFVNKQLKPLSELATNAERISQGEYDLTIKPTKRKDEIGILQNSFRTMHTALFARISELNRLTSDLLHRHKELNSVYAEVENANETKIRFIHDIADQMLAPVKVIDSSVHHLKEKSDSGQKEDMELLMKKALRQIKIITGLIDKLAR